MAAHQRIALLSALLALPVFTNAAIQWGNCSSNVPLATPALQCAELQVPLDWSNPSGENITLGLTRVVANDTANRIGSLLVNPGGPGVPASELIAGQAAGFPLFSNNLSAVFDIVGMDPRGIGLSTPVMCDPDLWNQRVTSRPSSEEEYDNMVATNTAIWESCANMTGPLFYNVDTLSVARDVEALRVALDEGGLNFLGISYGTQIAQTYAQLYPANYRAIAMDGIVDHNSSATNLYVGEASTFEAIIPRFAAWCNGTNSTNCPLTGTDVQGLITQLVTNATADPIPAPGCDGTSLLDNGCYANITADEMLFTIQNLILFEPANPPVTPGWPGLAGALALAVEGNATALAQAYAASFIATSNSSGPYQGSTVSCLDSVTGISDYADARYRMNLGRHLAPTTLGMMQTWNTQITCVGFPGGPVNPQTDMTIYNNGSDATAIMMVQSTFDPSCTYVWAENVREGIANVSMLVREGNGHTSYFLYGEASRAIDRYLIDLEVPPQNTMVTS